MSTASFLCLKLRVEGLVEFFFLGRLSHERPVFESLVIVTQDGCEVMNAYPKQLTVID